MNDRRDRQQLVRGVIYLAEIAILIAAVALAARFLPGQKGGGAGSGTEASQETGPLTELTEPDRELPKETEEVRQPETEEVISKEQQKPAPQTEEEPVQPPREPPFFIVASDIHYQSPKMTDFVGEAFCQFVRWDDGKVIPYLDTITDAFLKETAEKQPDALILSGDLTQNGELVNHESLTIVSVPYRCLLILLSVSPVFTVYCSGLLL